MTQCIHRNEPIRLIAVRQGGYYEITEKAHSHVESRRFYMFEATLYLNDAGQCDKLRSIVYYEKRTFNMVTGI